MKVQFGVLFIALLLSKTEAKGLLLSEITHLKSQIKDIYDFKNGKLKERKLAVLSMNHMDNGIGKKSRSYPRVDRYLKPTKPRTLSDVTTGVNSVKSKTLANSKILKSKTSTLAHKNPETASLAKNVQGIAKKLPLDKIAVGLYFQISQKERKKLDKSKKIILFHQD